MCVTHEASDHFGLLTNWLDSVALLQYTLIDCFMQVRLQSQGAHGLANRYAGMLQCFWNILKTERVCVMHARVATYVRTYVTILHSVVEYVSM